MTNPTPPRHHLAAVHEAVSARVPDRACIVFRGRRWSYAEVTARGRRLANALHARGLGGRLHPVDGSSGHESPHDHVAIYAHNGNEYLEAMLGAFEARMAPVNINYRYVTHELEYVLENSRSAAIVYHSAFAPTLAAVLPQLPHLRVLLQIRDDSGNELLPGAEWYEEALASAPATLPEWAGDWSPDDLYILYTGGTTGLPKGVLWRHADIHRTTMGGRAPITREPWPSLEAIADAAGALEHPTVLCPAAPFMHGSGHWVAFMGMNQGWTVVIQDVVTRLDAADLCRTVEREGVNYLQIVGDAFARPILDELEAHPHDLSSLRTVLSGGTALSPSLKARFMAALPHLTVIDSIGSSEDGGQGIQMTSAAGTTTSGTFTPSEGSVVVAEDLSRVLDRSDTTIGWLAKQGPDIPLGYLGDPAKSARSFPIVGGERMSVPGDRARWLADGAIELLGRESVTINSGGEKIFAEEVEAAVLRHPDVYDAIVTSRPSQRWGREVVAIVRLRDGASCTEAELATVAAEHIARYKLPKAWVFVPTIQRSPAGKADYRWAESTAAAITPDGAGSPPSLVPGP